MAFQLGEDHDNGMNEMNLIPLIMLVLMIIFLVTATVANPSIPLTLLKQLLKLLIHHQKQLRLVSMQMVKCWDTQVISLDELQKRFQKQVKVLPTSSTSLIKSRSTILLLR